MSSEAIDIHEVGPDELATWAALNSRGFLNPRRPSAARLDMLRKQLSYLDFRMARIDGLPCGVYRTWDRACGLIGEPGDANLDRPAVIARDPDGTVVGTASYRITGDWALDSPADIKLEDLTASTPAGYRALWAYLASLDLIGRIRAADRPVHEPLPWILPDRRAVTEEHRTDFQWIRILDLPAALTARTAQAPGAVVLEVLDPLGYAAGRWLVDADETGHIAVSSAPGRDPDLTLPVQTLGAAYLGQTSLTRLHAAGLADEHRRGAVRRLDAMLSWAPSGVVGHTWF